MDAARLKRWQATETIMERARSRLPEPAENVRGDFCQAISEYQDFLSHNELGLAFDSLRYAAELVPSRGSVWKDLIRAAELMELNEVVPALE
jgi:hypothetical protein